jgi:hypothetical protein
MPLSRTNDHPVEFRPTPQAVSIWERSIWLVLSAIPFGSQRKGEGRGPKEFKAMKRLCFITFLISLLGLGVAQTMEPDGTAAGKARSGADAVKIASATKQLFCLSDDTPEKKAQVGDAFGQRVCVKSYPWPFSLSEERLQNLRASEMRKIRDKAASLTLRYLSRDPSLADGVGDLAEHEKKHLDALVAGRDAEQVLLYGDYLYLAMLHRERNFHTATQFVHQLRKTHDLSARPAPWDAAHDSSYYSRQSLRNFIVLLDFSARAWTAPKNLDSLTRLSAEFLDVRDILQKSGRDMVDPGFVLFDRLEDLLSDLPSKQPELGKKLSKLSAVYGVERSGQVTTLYLKGQQLHTVRFDPQRDAFVVPRALAAAQFEQSRSRALKEGSSQRRQLFHALPAGDGYEFQWADGSSVTLSKMEWERLKAGDSLPTDHALSQALEAHAAADYVFWDGPFLQKGGHLQDDAKALLTALQKSYPKARFSASWHNK